MQSDVQFLSDKIALLMGLLPRGDGDLLRLGGALKVIKDADSNRELGYLDTEIDRQALYHREMTPEFGKTGYRAFYSQLRAAHGRARVCENARVIARRALKRGMISDEHEAQAVHALLSGDLHGRAAPDEITMERYQRLITTYEQQSEA